MVGAKTYSWWGLYFRFRTIDLVRPVLRRLQSAAVSLGIRHKPEIWHFSPTYLMSVLLPARIQAVIYLLYIARQVQIMWLLLQILYSALLQDHTAIKIGRNKYNEFKEIDYRYFTCVVAVLYSGICK